MLISEFFIFLICYISAFCSSACWHAQNFLKLERGGSLKTNGKQRFGKNSKKSPSHRHICSKIFPSPNFVLAARAHVISRCLHTHCFYSFISLTMNMTLHYFSLSGCPHADRCSLQAQHQDLK